MKQPPALPSELDSPTFRLWLLFRFASQLRDERPIAFRKYDSIPNVTWPATRRLRGVFSVLDSNPPGTLGLSLLFFETAALRLGHEAETPEAARARSQAASLGSTIIALASEAEPLVEWLAQAAEAWAHDEDLPEPPVALYSDQPLTLWGLPGAKNIYTTGARKAASFELVLPEEVVA